MDQLQKLKDFILSQMLEEIKDRDNVERFSFVLKIFQGISSYKIWDTELPSPLQLFLTHINAEHIFIAHGSQEVDILSAPTSQV